MLYFTSFNCFKHLKAWKCMFQMLLFTRAVIFFSLYWHFNKNDLFDRTRNFGLKKKKKNDFEYCIIKKENKSFIKQYI